MSFLRLLCVGICFLLVGCETPGPVGDVFADRIKQLDAHGYPSLNPESGGSKAPFGTLQSSAAPAGVVQQGTGTFVANAAQVVPETRRNGDPGYSLNLVGVTVAVAAKSVLGDVLNANYVVDPRVNGTVTLQTSQPVSRDVLVEILESALAVNGAAIVRKGSSYQIVPAGDALATAPMVAADMPSGPGTKVQVIELQYIGAEEMKGILEPISHKGAVLRADPARNLLMLVGSNADLASMRDAISAFDVDWMKGMSVALHPLAASQPKAVADELTTIFATDNGPGANLIKFIPNERLNSVLVITSRKNLLPRASAWISKLDKLASSNEKQLFVYSIQNRPAKELAQVLQAVLAGQDADTSSEGSVAPDLKQTTVSSFDSATNEAASSENEAASPDNGTMTDATPSAPSQAKLLKTSVVADLENNALLISTTQREYERIQPLLRQLDVMPTQVLIEAVIAEVSLNDELKFGLRWFFEKGNFSVGLSDLSSGATTAAYPGFAWSFATNDVSVTLNALSSITNVNIVSAPTLTVMNNQQAVLQVGDQVPIVTQQSTSTVTGNSAIVSSIQLKDTGVILRVLPRVNTSGRVMLEIEQEVSNVVKTTTSGIDSPTIQQRKLTTRVVVGDNESLALGGLIQQRDTLARTQVPILGSIPLIGNAFKNKDDSINKTELLVFIKPRIVRDVWQAREVTEEFRKQLDFSSPLRKTRGGSSTTAQDAKRLVY